MEKLLYPEVQPSCHYFFFFFVISMALFDAVFIYYYLLLNFILVAKAGQRGSERQH